MNRGKIYVQLSKSPWKLSDNEPAPSGHEFERFTGELDSFLSGYFFALKHPEAAAYTRGDFFSECTEAIYFNDRKALTVDFVGAVQKWLSAERRQNWRVLVPGAKLENNYIVIYHDTVVLSTRAQSLTAAILEK